MYETACGLLRRCPRWGEEAEAEAVQPALPQAHLQQQRLLRVGQCSVQGRKGEDPEYHLNMENCGKLSSLKREKDIAGTHPSDSIYGTKGSPCSEEFCYK